MSKALVVKYQSWYQGISNMRNYYEGHVENQALNLAQGIFEDFFCLRCKFKFKHATAKTRVADLILVSKRFNKWILVEVELIKKRSWDHTKSQLTVFIAPIFNPLNLSNYLIQNHRFLLKYKSQLLQLFTNKDAEVTVLLDNLNFKIKENILSQFPSVSICSLEIYKEFDSDWNLYIVKGDYPHVTLKWTMLIPLSNVQHFHVHEIYIFTPLKDRVIYLKAQQYGGEIKGYLMPDNGKLILKLINHPFEAGKTLKVEKDLQGNYHIKYL